MMPCFSSRSMRLCTLVRERPTSRANCAVEARPFSRNANNSFSSMASMAIRRFSPVKCRSYTFKTSKTTLPFAGAVTDNGAQYSGVTMKDIVVVGAGKIGSMIAELLGGSGDYKVTVVDRSQAQLDRL